MIILESTTKHLVINNFVYHEATKRFVSNFVKENNQDEVFRNFSIYKDNTKEVMCLIEKYICIEITESVAMNGTKLLTYAINKFRDAAYEVQMDDFSRAYSSLND